MGLSGPFKLLFSEADQTYTLECPRTVKAEGIKKRRLGGSKEEEEFFNCGLLSLDPFFYDK